MCDVHEYWCKMESLYYAIYGMHLRVFKYTIICMSLSTQLFRITHLTHHLAMKPFCRGLYTSFEVESMLNERKMIKFNM